MLETVNYTDHSGRDEPHAERGSSGLMLAWLLVAIASVGLAHAQDPLPGPLRKPQAPAGPPLPPLPRVKGTIAKAPETPDGKVAALNEGTFNVLQEIKRKNPGSLTLEDALALRNAIIHDDQIDAEEADLLSEMTQHNFRNITVTKAGKTEPPARVMTFPTVTQANTVLRETLNPQLNLETSWTAGAQGWRDIIQESGVSSEQAQRVAAFLQSRVAEAWQASTPSNAWKPFRDLIAQRYGLTKTSGLPAERMEQARKLMMDACRATNDKSHNQIPGHLYEWWKPAPPP